MEEYRTLGGYGRAEIEEKRSIFIGSADFVETEDEAVAFINRIRAEFPDARHNVYAYLLREGAKTRYSDDKEPQGTAGMPVLEVLRKSNCLDAVIVVTRYFGGILLGAGGLARAYTEAAAAAVRAAGPVLRSPCVSFAFSSPYSDYERYRALLASQGAILGEPEFGADVTVRYTVKEKAMQAVAEKLYDASLGRITPKKCGEGWENLPI